VLNPSKSEDYDPNLTERDIFSSLSITEEEYCNALSISPDSDCDLHLKRPLDSCFINNYFAAGIKRFAANVDLQPVFTTVFVDTRLWKTKHSRKRFQNFRQSYVLSTCRIEIHQSQPLV